LTLREAKMATSLTREERRQLLSLARDTLSARFDGRPSPEPELTIGALTEIRGAFVTVTIDGALRGCIGHVIGHEPLWRCVRENSIAAAFHDPRFPPLTADELIRVLIEVSALSRLEVAGDPSAIEIGRHGLLIERGSSRGLLLPQVAEKNQWDRTTFLEQTCRKAGLEPGCWHRKGAVLKTFTVEHFSEDELA
jgi:AmmeMemoRadiSam system protein A